MYTINPAPRPLDFSEIDDISDLYSILNFSQQPFALPEDPTDEEFDKAEKVILQMAIEQQIDPYAFAARERGENIGNIIDPLNLTMVKRVGAGHYQGAFSHDGQGYKFTIKPEGKEFVVSYSPYSGGAGARAQNFSAGPLKGYSIGRRR